MKLTPERLRQLRTQAGAAIARGEPASRSGDAPCKRALGEHEDTPITLPTADRVALRRLLVLRGRGMDARAGVRRGLAEVHDRSLPGEEIEAGLWQSEQFLPQKVPPAPLSLAFDRRPQESIDPHRILFFDTETTGLAGGSGTRAFMIGAADWHCDASGRSGVRVRQLLIATLAAEPAMLRTFAGWLAPDSVLASYNGRCYDAPLLRARYRLARQGDPLATLAHLDLLFPTRRRWRGQWENCRLATIERNALGIVREDDLPGSEAPAAWLDFLRGGSAVKLRRVARHNHQDVVTLAHLLQRLVELESESISAIP